ncbi:MAG: hypothetical protein WCJ58_00840 [bacterium]
MKGKIFNTQEVQAIIAGDKTQFREVGKHKDFSNERCPYQIGQKIFCKEAFALKDEGGKFFQFRPFKAYKADAECDFAQWKPAQHMKQEHSRLTLLIKEIRVERLSEISKEDAIAEAPQYSIIEPFGNKCPIDFFKTLWNYTHKKPKEKFEADPWVWVVNFEVVK